MRLDKYLADCGLGTRSEVKKIIKTRQVLVDGNPAKDPGMTVTNDMQVTVDGQRFFYEPFEYYMLNKPADVISQSRKNSLKRGQKAFDYEDENGVVSVVDLIDCSGKTDLFPVGRLDKDTEGLLLISNDGQLAHRLLSPAHHVAKTYLAVLDAALSEKDIQTLENGVDIGDPKPTLPCNVIAIEEPLNYHITITEGRYHQVKRMFASVGKHVVYLKRISFGSIDLDPRLLPGEYRRLTDVELQKLKSDSE